MNFIKLPLTFITIILLLQLNLNAQSSKEKITNYAFIDTIKATGLLQKISISAINSKKEINTGIGIDDVTILFESHKTEREIVMKFPKKATVLSKGIGVEVEDDNEFEFDYNWQLNTNYQLYLTTATDSALNFTVYSGYIYLPIENKWKLIGTVKIEGKWGFLAKAYSLTTKSKKTVFNHSIDATWLQQSNGRFKNLLNQDKPIPILAPFSNIDSLAQALTDSTNIKANANILENIEGVFYEIETMGEGKKVELTDTVTVFYKGYIFETNAIFDQTKEKPATFPLNRLIKGWQLAVPKINIGGNIKIIIPSGLAYSIRTRSPKIPPNSNLVFEIKVVDATPKQ